MPFPKSFLPARNQRLVNMHVIATKKVASNIQAQTYSSDIRTKIELALQMSREFGKMRSEILEIAQFKYFNLTLGNGLLTITKTFFRLFQAQKKLSALSYEGSNL
jgi:site-specific DNA-adenine methylase